MNTTEMIERVTEMREQLAEMSAAGVAKSEFAAATRALDLLEATLELRRVQLPPTMADLERVRAWAEQPYHVRAYDYDFAVFVGERVEHPFWGMVAGLRQSTALQGLHKTLDELLNPYCGVEIYGKQFNRVLAAQAAGFDIVSNKNSDLSIATYNRATGYDRAVLDRLVAADVIDGYTDLAQEAAERWLV